MDGTLFIFFSSFSFFLIWFLSILKAFLLSAASFTINSIFDTLFLYHINTGTSYLNINSIFRFFFCCSICEFIIVTCTASAQKCLNAEINWDRKRDMNTSRIEGNFCSYWIPFRMCMVGVDGVAHKKKKRKFE